MRTGSSSPERLDATDEVPDADRLEQATAHDGTGLDDLAEHLDAADPADAVEQRLEVGFDDGYDDRA